MCTNTAPSSTRASVTGHVYKVLQMEASTLENQIYVCIFAISHTLKWTLGSCGSYEQRNCQGHPFLFGLQHTGLQTGDNHCLTYLSAIFILTEDLRTSD